MSPLNAASAYQAQAVQTANGPRLHVMLCERLSVDMSRAVTAIESRNFEDANLELQHAQRIVRMLRTSLDPDGFVGGQELLAVYNFLETHLVKANLTKDVALVRESMELFEPIHEAWRQAVEASERISVPDLV